MRLGALALRASIQRRQAISDSYSYIANPYLPLADWCRSSYTAAIEHPKMAGEHRSDAKTTFSGNWPMTFDFHHSKLDEKPILIPQIGLTLRVRVPPETTGGAFTAIETVNAP